MAKRLFPTASGLSSSRCRPDLAPADYQHGFGITSKRLPGYGEGPDEVLTAPGAATARVVALLLAGAPTTPPPRVRLRELRAERSLSQVELAKKLRVNQAAVSKLEKRQDLRVGTLREVALAMGGELVVCVRFPEGMKELSFDDDQPPATAVKGSR
jgi:DNA-binding XRE family transcriptional regulator